jgi:hypothetical protein
MVSAATAAERVLPRQMLGTWCGVPAEWKEIDKRVFERGKCDPEDDTSILVRPDGYLLSGHGFQLQNHRDQQQA